ncbi:MBL fold metallo-hydrolase [candidate division WOR-3 bacterium]|nr:MBL fold metallo-hydrolase [candidate division WOR-3 bacterium]
MKSIIPVTIFLFITMGSAVTKNTFEKDTVATSIGDLEITFIRHATLMFVINGTVIHIDPWSDLADYTKLPDADLILITHHHSDHLDAAAVKEIRTDSTIVVLSELCAQTIKGGIVMKSGDEKTVLNIPIITVPAYNIEHKRDNGVPFHVKGEGNGYILIFGDTRVYIAGDTENTPEMKALKDIDIAFLPMNLPYTMTPDMVADAAKAFNPTILYPYHFGDTNTSELLELLKDEPGIEVRIRNMP